MSLLYVSSSIGTLIANYVAGSVVPEELKAKLEQLLSTVTELKDQHRAAILEAHEQSPLKDYPIFLFTEADKETEIAKLIHQLPVRPLLIGVQSSARTLGLKYGQLKPRPLLTSAERWKFATPEFKQLHESLYGKKVGYTEQEAIKPPSILGSYKTFEESVTSVEQLIALLEHSWLKGGAVTQIKTGLPGKQAVGVVVHYITPLIEGVINNLSAEGKDVYLLSFGRAGERYRFVKLPSGAKVREHVDGLIQFTDSVGRFKADVVELTDAEVENLRGITIVGATSQFWVKAPLQGFAAQFVNVSFSYEPVPKDGDRDVRVTRSAAFEHCAIEATQIAAATQQVKQIVQVDAPAV